MYDLNPDKAFEVNGNLTKFGAIVEKAPFIIECIIVACYYTVAYTVITIAQILHSMYREFKEQGWYFAYIVVFWVVWIPLGSVLFITVLLALKLGELKNTSFSKLRSSENLKI